MRTLILLSLVTVAFSAIVTVDVNWNAIYPSSSWLNPGDTLRFQGTNASEAHWIVQILPDFSGQNFSGQILSNQSFFGAFQYDVNIVDDRSMQGILWADLFNPATSGFGIVYVAREDDVYIQFNVFATHPPINSNFALKQYPENKQILKGQRVVWDTSEEPLLNHPLFFTDRQFHATINCPYAHSLVSNRNFHKFAWQFDKIGKFNYICGVHPSMNGTIHVCKANGNCDVTTVRVCPYAGDD